MFKLTKSLVFAVSCVVAIGFIIYTANSVVAAIKTLNSGSLQITFEDQGGGRMFHITNFAPGDEEEKNVLVKNNGTVDHSFALGLKNISDKLKNVVKIEARIDGNFVFEKTLAELVNDSVIIPTVHPGESKSVKLVARFDPNAPNEYQNRELSFDMEMGTQEEEPTPTPVPATATATVAPTQIATGVIDVSVATPLSSVIISTPTQTPAATATAVTGEVKGEQTGGPTGEMWELLLIVPIVGIISTFTIKPKTWRAIILPLISGIIALILSFIFVGTFPTWLFYLLLALEVIVFFILESFIKKEDQEEPGKKFSKKS